MRNICLKLAYDGTRFSGWQIQPERRTVQGVLEQAIKDLTGETLRVLCAGRTDAGVHALGQVANFRTNSTIPGEKWSEALACCLPEDVVVIASQEVALDFHATYSACSKRYRYLIRQSSREDPFLRRYAWRLSSPLNLTAMQAASSYLLGQHDFRCFESHYPNKATSVRTVLSAEMTSLKHWIGWGSQALARPMPTSAAGEYLAFEIEADGFLYNMVRTIVGSLVEIGREKEPPEWIGQLIQQQSRSSAGATAPAHGLYLVDVQYSR